MTFAVSTLSLVPVRSAPNGKSELVTQLLFGELAEIIEPKGRQWFKVRALTDNTIGWVAQSQLQLVTPAERQRYETDFAFCLDLFQPVLSDHHSQPVTLGARLPAFDGMRFDLAGNRYTYSGLAVFPNDLRPTSEMLQKLARKYLFAPEMAGGRSPLGIDAGGFSQMVFSYLGTSLYRRPEQQVFQGEPVDFIEQSAPGDLAFFEDRKGNIRHVGILLPEGQIIHAHGYVRIDRIDHYGIFNDTDGRYSHRLRVIRRFPLLRIARLDPPLETDSQPSDQIRLFG